jgi:hypothetical protein
MSSTVAEARTARPINALACSVSASPSSRFWISGNASALTSARDTSDLDTEDVPRCTCQLGLSTGGLPSRPRKADDFNHQRALDAVALL